MGEVSIAGSPREGTLSAVVLNADGSVKANLGTVTYYHRNPVIRLIRGSWIKFWSGRRIRRFNKESNNVLPPERPD